MKKKQTPKRRIWNGMNWIRQEKRLAIYMRDGLACVYCGAGLEEDVQLTLDHYTPVSRGGNNDARNLVTACKTCNSARGKRTVRSFVKTVAEYHCVEDWATIYARVNSFRRRTLSVNETVSLLGRRGYSSRRILNALRSMREEERPVRRRILFP